MIQYKSIGIIHTPYKTKDGMPIQPSGAKGIKGTIKINPDLAEGLKDLEGFSHVILLYHFHKVTDYELMVVPFMDDQLRGVFSTRAPKRPNSIGLSVVKLNGVEGNILHVENIDVLDGTPLIDIKPLIPDIDFANVEKLGWLEGKTEKMSDKKADKRFT
jgi:tRNA-Thr(GGU) m(6)t(6)A37 methyltransferase TsaA